MPTLDEAFDTSFAAPKAASADPLDMAYEKSFGGRDSQLRATLKGAVQVEPEAAAEAARLAKRYPAPQDVLVRNLKDVKLREAVDNYDATLKTSPALAEYLLAKPWAAKQLHKDIPGLAGVERGFMSGLRSGYTQADNQMEMADLLYAELTGQRLNESQTTRLNQLRAENRVLGRQQQGEGTLEMLARTNAYGIRQFGSSIWSMIQGAGYGSATGAAAGSVLPGVGTAAGAVAGATAGVFTATSAYSYKIESAFAYEDFRDLRDLNGQPIPTDIARTAAMGVGVVNAVLESTAGMAMLKLIPGVDRAIGTLGGDAAKAAVRTQVRNALANPVMRSTIVQSLTKVAAGMSIEGVEEFFQTLVGAGGREVAQAMSGQTFKPDSLGDDLAEAGTAAKEAALGQLALSSVVGGANYISLRRQSQRQAQYDRAIEVSENLRTQLQAVQDIQARAHSPEVFREVVQGMAEQTDGAPKSLWVDGEVLAQLPAEELQRLPAEVQAQIPDAAASSGFVEIPIGDIMLAEKGSVLEQTYVEYARETPSSPTLAEAQEAKALMESTLIKDAEGAIAQAQEQDVIRASSEVVRKTVLEQLNTAGEVARRYRPAVNDALARVTAALFTTQAQRMGMTPEEMFRASGFSVRGAGQQQGKGRVLNDARTRGLTVEGYHYSKQARPVVSTAMFGTGLAGSNRDLYLTAEDKRLRKRAYFYVDKGTGINPEAGVGGIAQKAQLTNIYDGDADPLRLKKGGQLAFESAVLDAGFSGYLTRLEGTQSGQVILLGDQAIQTEAIGPAGKLQGQVVPAPKPRESQGRDVIVDALNAAQGLPVGSPTRARWSEILQGRLPEVHAALQAAGVFDGEQNQNLYKSDLIKAFEAATEAPVYGQSATIRRGTETLRKYGLKPGKKYKTREVAAALEARQREKYGTIAADDRSPEALAKISKWMQAEVEFAMANPESSGVGWYSEKFQRALDIMAEQFPELATDKVARDTMTALIAITSDGQKVVPNFAQAMDIYGRFREGGETEGKFTTTRGHQRQASIDNNLAVLQRLYDQMGAEAMHEYLMQEKTISELKKLAKANGGDLKSDYQAHIKMPMAAVEFGPKLGAFYANLMGAHGYLTMDRWWSRTFNRYRGTLLQAPTRQGLDRFKELLGNPAVSDDEAIAATVEPRNAYEAKGFKNGTELEKAANTIYKAAFENLEDSPFNATDRTFMLDAVNKAQKSLARKGYNLSVADIQAILWYYEKRLYGELGARQTADISYEEAAQRVVAGYAGGSGIESLLDDTGAAPEDGGAGEGRVPVGEETFEEGGVNGEPQQAGDRGGRYSSGGLAPLEGAPDVLGAAGPDPRLVAVAEQYARDNGIELRRQAEYVQVDEARAARIAQAYAEMQHAPNDPKVKEAYADLIRQTRAQYDALVAAGYEFTFFDDASDPYQGNPWNAMRDLRANQRMAVYGTYAGFGVGADLNIGLADPAGGENLDPDAVLAAIKNIGGDIIGSVIHTSATEPTLVIKLKNKLDDDAAYRLSEQLGQEAIAQSFEDGTGKLYGPQAANWGEYNPEFFVTADGRRASETLNPLLADTGLQWPDQNGELKPVLANDLFRAVHDAFGHGLEGAGFRARGEENAWQAHVRLFTGPAVAAITSETRGQNSWLNYGPYGERNRTAKVEDTVFAEQKTGLMPEWTWSEGRADDAQDVLAQGPRGTYNPRNFEIVLNENANLSTYFHELSHFYLDFLGRMAEMPNASPEVVADWTTFLNWAGVSQEQWQQWRQFVLDNPNKPLPKGMVKVHEALARAGEQYFLEGKAPSVELQPFMRRFARWMESVYRSLVDFIAGNPDKSLQLNPDIRRFFDRALATDEQIAQAEQAAGMLPDDDATAEAKERLNKRSMAGFKWAVRMRDEFIADLRKQAKEIEGSIRQMVTEEVDAMPVMQAKAALDRLMAASPEYKADLQTWEEAREAERARATEAVKEQLVAAEVARTNAPLEGLAKGRFLSQNRAEVENKAEAAVLAWEKSNPRPRRLTPDMTPQMESIAEKYGYGGVDQMLQDIDAMGSRREMIDGLTEQRMLEEHGDLIDDRAIQQAANEAVHNDARARALATELRTQQEMLGARTDTGRTNSKGRRITVNTLLAAARNFASNVVGRARVMDLGNLSWKHNAAEARAGKRWQQLTSEGKTVEAVKAKQDQVIHNAAAKAALEAQTEVRKLLEYLKKFDKDSVRAKLPASYLDQIDKLLERVDLRVSTSRRDIDKRAALSKWIESQHALGLDPIVPDYLLDDAQLTSYKEMTVDQFRELADTIKNIEHFGRLKSRLLAAKDKREFDAIATEIANEIIANKGTPLEVKLEPDGRIKKFFKGAWADHRKLNSLVRQMDGGKDNGPFYRALIRSMNEAGTKENVMLEKATEALAKIYAPVEALPGGFSGASVYIPAIGASLSRAGRLAVALNWGNSTNRQRVMGGDNWTEAQVEAILATLSPVELEFVNNVWAHLDSYWPEMKAKQERVNGVVEDKVEAEPFEVTASDGTVVQMRGGYYPIKYDSDRSLKSQKNEAQEVAADMLRGAILRPTTRRGHLKARVEEVNRPVRKDLSVITQHVNQVVHDLAWHEWLIDAMRLLNDPRIAGAIRDYHGAETHRAMTDAMRAIAEGDIAHQTEIDKLLLAMRANVTRSIMGASLTTALLQPFGLTQSMARIGVVPVLKGAWRWAGDGAQMQSSMKWIAEKSDFMRLRSKTFNRELREISQRLQGKSKFMQVADASLFMLMQKMQMVADVPTWIGAYEKALAGGVDEATAVQLADEAVLSSQGGGNTKDLSGVQRNLPFLTQFYSYFNTTLQLVAEKTALTDFKNPRAAAGWLGDMALLAVIPAILPALITYLLKGGGEDDEPEDWAKRLAEWQASYLLGMFVGLRELPAIWSPFDYQGPPAGKLVNDGKRLVQQAGQGEIDDAAVLATIGFLGTALGIPTTQIIRSYKGWLAWDEGDAPPTAILFGPPPKD